MGEERKTRIFGLERDQLGRLFSAGMEEPEESDGAEAPSDGAGFAASLESALEQVGQWVGPYRLVRVLGEGGMGVVYLAEQERPIQRQVALKVIKPGMDSKRVVARFRAERQALALLDHPNIAHVYDAGTTDRGRPYFVMEYVEGLPITEHCDRNTLKLKERLGLFQQVCHAVYHAHQKGIIHRDIKPSNILVSTQDTRATPKIIDFGVAKAIAQPLTEKTLATEHGQLFGTPEYMSPEQADPGNEDIDTRSDVYSLGVLPLDTTQLREGGIDHVGRIIRETDPKTPSTRLTKLGQEAESVAASRDTDVATLAKHLHRELEWIPLKAMRKERAERYRSASELADDIENYLEGAPLIAGPPGAAYQLKKFVRRHKSLVASAILLTASLLLGFGVSVGMYLRSERSRQAEAAARIEAETVVDFIRNDLLAAAETITDREPTLRDALDIATARLEDRFKDHPRVEAQLCRMLGGTYLGLGDVENGFRYRERGCQIRREHLGETHPQTFNDTNWLGLAYSGSGRYKEAEALFKRVIKQAERDTSRNHDAWMRWFKCNLANVYRHQGRYQEAEQLMRTALETRRYWKPETLGLRIYGNCLGDLYVDLGRYEDAERTYRINDKLQREVDGDGAGWRSLHGLARLYVIQGRYLEAQDVLDEALAIWDRRPPSKTNRRWRLVAVHILGILRREQGAYAEAEGYLQEVYDARPPGRFGTLRSAHELAVLYLRQACYEDAEPLLLEAFGGRQTKLGPDHPHTLDSLRELVHLYESWDKPQEAAQWHTTRLDTDHTKD
jgi:eukaryotic-like serine/threonine-protein kinase